MFDNILFGTILCLFALSLPGNLVSLVLLRILRKESPRSTSYLMYTHLTSCDIVTTLVTMTFVMAGLLDKSLYENSEALETKVACNVIGFQFNVLSRCNLFIVAGIGMDRWLAVYKPFRYKRSGVMKIVRAYVFLAWTVSLLISCVPFMTGHLYAYSPSFRMCVWQIQVVFKESPVWISPMYFLLYICPVILPAVILVSCCVAVTFKLLLANKIIGRKIQLNEIPKDSSTVKRNTVLKKKRMEKQTAAVTMTFLAAAFTTCYIFWWFMGIVGFLKTINALPSTAIVSSWSKTGSAIASSLYVLMPFINSALNPYLYYVRNNRALLALKNLMNGGTAGRKPTGNECSSSYMKGYSGDEGLMDHPSK
ncbi:hypothetical protein ACHWQZ_G013339 [Mnemiopsis leidyi]